LAHVSLGIDEIWGVPLGRRLHDFHERADVVPVLEVAETTVTRASEAVPGLDRRPSAPTWLMARSKSGTSIAR
jgi:hypothetical protein